MARPTKLTPETHEQIVKALTAGATRTDAAIVAGVEYQTFLNWMERGRKARSGIYFEFFDAASKAEANVRVKMANVVIIEAQKDARWAVEYLKRRDRANWGDATAVELTGGVKVEAYNYGDAIAAIAARPDSNSGAPGKNQSGGDGPPVGEDADGG